MASNYPNGFLNGVTIRGVPLLQTHPGKVFWVASTTAAAMSGVRTASNGNDGTFNSPFATLDYAVGQCTAERGDIIIIKPGYTQTMAAADAVDVDVNGVAIIGLGAGSSRPKFTYSNAAGEFVIGADNVSISNLWFVPSVTAITTAIDVEAGSTYCTIANCEFSGRETAGDEFTAAITVNTTCTDFECYGCYFNSETDQAVYAISLATPTRAKIHNNVIMGDYSTACVGTITGAGVNCELMDNVIVNGIGGDLGTVACFTQSAAGSWLVGGNKFACDVATAILFFTNYTSTVNLGNVYTDDTTMAATAVDRTASIVVMADG